MIVAIAREYNLHTKYTVNFKFSCRVVPFKVSHCLHAVSSEAEMVLSKLLLQELYVMNSVPPREVFTDQCYKFRAVGNFFFIWGC